MFSMNIQDYVTTYAPSPHTVEKILDILARIAPHPKTVETTLVTLSTWGPQAASVWMLPLIALGVSVVHALLTRRAGMMVGAAFILCFYTAGHLFLPAAEVSDEKQMALLTTLHTWFSCVASELFFLCVAMSLLAHFIGIGWRYYRANKTKNTSLPAPVASSERPVKKAPVPKPRSTTATAQTLNDLSALRKANAPSKPKSRVRKEPVL